MTTSELMSALKQCKPAASVSVVVPDSERPSLSYVVADFDVRPQYEAREKKASSALLVLPPAAARPESFHYLVAVLLFIDDLVIRGRVQPVEVEHFAAARRLIEGRA